MSKEKFYIKIEDIENAPDKRLQINFEDFIEGINTKRPIEASLEADSVGEFIKVAGHVSGTAILDCDLCLNEFDYEINFDIDELFAKNALMEEYGAETELKEGQFVTDLKGKQELDIYDLLYQSVILDFPNKKVCGINCKGSNFEKDKNLIQNEVDPRLEVFKNIKVEKETNKTDANGRPLKNKETTK